VFDIFTCCLLEADDDGDHQPTLVVDVVHHIGIAVKAVTPSEPRDAKQQESAVSVASTIDMRIHFLLLTSDSLTISIAPSPSPTKPGLAPPLGKLGQVSAFDSILLINF
jgi:hypothetical protein